MSRAARVEQYLPLLPAALRQLFDAELAAGNELNDVEVGDGAYEGRVFVVVDYPFRSKRSPLPAGVMYREFLDRDPMLFEYYMADETFSLVAGKLKPMVLEPLPPGPVNPTEAAVIEAERYEREVEAAAVMRAARPPDVAPVPPIAPPPTTTVEAAGKRFIDSMTMTFDMWHDGTGYDLAALDAATPEERAAIETILLQRQPRDWRKIEALARIDSPAARAAVVAALKSADPQVRSEAMRHAGEKADPADRERRLLTDLQSDDIYGGLSQAIDEAAEFHPPAVVEALFRGALHRTGQTAILFAGLLYFIHGKSASAFDWDHRPFFLRFDTADSAERRAVFHELCDAVGVDASRYF